MNRKELSTLSRALIFAARKHRDQRRLDQVASPYINHPISLMHVLIEEGGINSTEVICAALLHDTVEDTETTHEELMELFGESVAGMVLEVTDDKQLEKQARKRAQVEHAPHLSIGAKAVKLADKISNLRDLIHSPPDGWSMARRQAYFDWALEVIDGLRGDHPVLEAIFDSHYEQRPAGE